MKTSPPDYLDELKEHFNRLLIDGKQFEATSKDIDISKQPSYFNLERFKRAQLVLQKYYINISLASSTGLIWLLQLEPIYIPLIKTGKSRTVSDNYDRYTSTAKYIRSLYETDFFQSTSEGWKYISLVRGMHQRVFKLMKDDTSMKQSDNTLWVNQYDMALTQFAFIGLFLSRPNMCGAYHISKDQLRDIAYYWRIISYYLGIEERFNIFVYADDLDKQTTYLNLILEHVNNLLRTTRANSSSSIIGFKMAQSFMFSFEDFNTTSSLNILDHWWAPVMSLTGSDELKPYSLKDKGKVVLFLLYFKVLLRNETLLKYINIMYKKKFDKFCSNGVEIKSKLAKKYKDYVNEL